MLFNVTKNIYFSKLREGTCTSGEWQFNLDKVKDIVSTLLEFLLFFSKCGQSFKLKVSSLPLVEIVISVFGLLSSQRQKML